MGKPPETWIDAEEGPVPVYVELIDLGPSDDGPRVQIPAVGRACVGWLKGAPAQQALVEISDPGRILLRPWQTFGESVVRRRRLLRDNLEEEGLDELIALTERFRRITIEKNGRFPVHSRELFHLGLGPLTGWTAFVICTPSRIELWNEQYRRQWRANSPFDPPWQGISP